MGMVAGFDVAKSLPNHQLKFGVYVDTYPPPTPKTSMAMRNPPFEDAFPMGLIEHGDFSIAMSVFRGVKYELLIHI